MPRAAAGLCVVLASACVRFPEQIQTTPSADAGAGTADAGANDASADAGTTPALRATGLARGLAEHHSCALLEDGTAWCWGDNTRGQLGGPSGTALRPRLVAGLSGVDELAVGAEHTCARTGASVRCFGRNDRGQLGTGSSAPEERAPMLVPQLDDAVAITAGHSFTCALRTGGAVACWGALTFDAIGDPVPRDVGPLPAPAVAITAGAENGAVILESGELWIFGAGGCNRLGLGDDAGSARPIHVSTLPAERIVDAAMGDLHGCAVTASGDVYCWGCSGAGQVGTGTTTRGAEFIAPPARVLAGAIAVDASFRATCALMADGNARCWGANDRGQLGDGAALPAEPSAAPARIEGLTGAQELELYWQHACARLPRGVACWGYGERGQIGDGGELDAPFPATVLF